MISGLNHRIGEKSSFIDEIVFVNGIPRRMSDYMAQQTVGCVTMGPVTFIITVEPDKPVITKPTLWQYLKDLAKEAF